MAISVTGLTNHTQVGSGTWLDYGSGGGSAINTDVFLSSTSSRARKVSNGIKGFAFEVNAAGTDLSNTVIAIRWATLAGVGALDTRALSGVVIRVEDTSGNQSDWAIDGADTYGGGWRVSVIDTSVVETTNSGTAATMTAIQYVGIVWDATASIGGGDPNCYIDEVLSWPNTGLTIGGNSTSVLSDLQTFDDTNDYGIFETRSGILYSKANLVISPDASDFSDADVTLVFENPAYYDGTTAPNISACLSEVGLSSSDADNTTLTRCVVVADTNGGEITNTDSNREFDISGATDFDLDTCTLRGFDGTAAVSLGGSGQSITATTFQDCGQVTETGAVIRDSVFRNSTNTAGSLLWDNTTTDVQDSLFDVASGGHGVEHDTIESVATGTVTTADGAGTTLTDTAANFTSTTAAGEYIYNETDGSYAGITSVDSATQVTCEALQGGTDNDFDLSDAYSISPAQAYTNLTFIGAGTDVNNTATGSDGLFVSKSGTSDPATATGNVVFIGSVVVSVTVVDGTNTPIENAQTTIRLSSDNSEIINTDTNASGVAAGNFTGSVPAAALVKVRKSSTGDTRYENFSTTSTITTDGLSLTVVLTEDGAL
jgi:hypothetical protein